MPKQFTFFLFLILTIILALINFNSPLHAAGETYRGILANWLTNTFNLNQDQKANSLDLVYLTTHLIPADLPSNTPTPPLSVSCLTQSGSLTTLSGVRSPYSQSLATNTKVNATTATWTGQDTFISLKDGDHLCWSGGNLYGTWPATVSWNTMHGPRGLALSDSLDTTIEKLRISTQGDGISAYGTTDRLTIRSVYMENIHDDCVEGDWQPSITIEDSLFNGCYVGFAGRARSGVSGNHSSNTWVIKNTLVFLHDQIGVYSGASPGHGALFKWDSNGPMLELHHNIFRIDSTNSCCSDWGAIPSGKLAACSHNTMVWLGPGNFPFNLPTTFQGHPCFTITKDKTIWDQAVAHWLLTH